MSQRSHEYLLTRLLTSFSYLTDRKFTIKLNNVTSKEYTLKHGVPQGSVLGLVLYTMYTHCLKDVIKCFLLFYHMYSDDNQIYKSSNLNNFQDLVDNVEKCIDHVEATVCSTIHKLIVLIFL